MNCYEESELYPRPTQQNFIPVLACEMPGLRFWFTFSSLVLILQGQITAWPEAGAKVGVGMSFLEIMFVPVFCGDSVVSVVLLMVSVTVKQTWRISSRARKLHIKQLNRILWLEASNIKRCKIT